MEVAMAAIQQQLLDVLGKIDRPGTFCTSGSLPAALPGLEVAGAGPVSLPLAKRQAADLKKQARQAPYGKGTRTLVDTSVRRVWEIDADQVVLANPDWGEVVKRAVGTVQADLGLERQKLEAHLYKLLLYEPGSFFLPHRDGEKLDRMVATLVITLPSAHEGGELVVRHDGREVTVDFSPQSRFQTQFAAFYADCEHEIRPVTRGIRLSLVYNLTLAKTKTKAKRTITAPTTREHVAAAASLLQHWKRLQPAASKARAKSPPKLAMLLDHEYTKAGLTRDALKGADRARAEVLFAAAREAECDAALALVTYWVSGSAEGDADYGYRRYGRYGWDEYDDEYAAGDHVMGEVFDSSLTAEHFSDAEGNRLEYGQLPLDQDEIVSTYPWNEGEPDEEDFEGYTGNAGMTLERWYHHAAVVLWPGESRFDVLCQAGVEAAVGGLDLMVRRWKQAPRRERERLRDSCLEFARRIIAHWPERKFASKYPAFPADKADAAEDDELDQDDEFDQDEEFDEDEFEGEEAFDEEDEDFLEDDEDDEDDGGFGAASLQADRPATQFPPRTLLSLLNELGDASLIAAWIRNVLAKDASIDPGKALGDVCQRHGWTTFQKELLALFDGTTQETLERHARLLADWALRKDKGDERKSLCSRVAGRLMSAVERWNPKQPRRDWRARAVDRSGLLPPLAQAFLALNQPELFDRLATYVLKQPKEFDLTTVQVPALLSLEPWLKRNVKRSSPVLERWLSAVVEELESRKAHPPQEPTDWRRDSTTGCKCADCQDLSHFLKDRQTQTLRLPLAKHRRRHLHEIIDRKKLDTTHATERRGRPYTLVCTKTKASYERALQAHQVDLDHLAKARKLLAWHRGLESSARRPKARRKRS